MLINQISDLRNDWSGIKSEDIFLYKKWKIPINFPEKGQNRKKKLWMSYKLTPQ